MQNLEIEMLDIIDEENNLTGKTAERDIIHENGIWHREVAVWIMNKNGDILLQKRSSNKRQEPNKWATCAEHVDAGETTDDAIIREIEEEIGIKVDLKDLEFLNVYKKKNDVSNLKNYNFQYMYFLKINYKIEDYTICLDELSEIKYISFIEFENMINSKDTSATFTKHEYMQEVLEILRKRI